MNNIANANQFFDADTISALGIQNGAVILTIGELHVTLTPESARSVILKLMSAALVADGKQTRIDILAAADKIRAEEF